MLQPVDHNDKLEFKQGDTFYSVYFDDPDPNKAMDVVILEHESCFDRYTSSCTNAFATREEAESAREHIINQLRLER